MSGYKVTVLALVAAMLIFGEAKSFADGGAKDTGALRQLLAGAARDAAAKREPLASRTERRAHLSEDDRELMTKQIMQAISEMMTNSECMSDRDYQGWVDFGRRDAE